MREILFRGKRVLYGEWVVGSLIIDGYACDIFHEDKHGIAGTSAVIPETVGQYTGLRDKNGVQIFEGDLLSSPAVPSMPYTVIWNASDFKTCWAVKRSENCLDIGDCSMFEVVGNIHDGAKP